MDESADEDEILRVASEKLRNMIIEQGISENLDDIIDDEECPEE